ncbi:MAG: hypothetical protein ACTHKQ_11855 [Mesorhizobium sp.]
MDVWKIGVTMSLTNAVSPVIAVIVSDLLGLKGNVKDVEGEFRSWQPAIAGAIAALTGTAMIGGILKLADAGSEVNHQLELMKVAGMQNVEIQQAMAQAMQTAADVQTTTYAGNLEHIRELRYAFGRTDEADQFLTDVSRSNSILNAVKGGGQDQVWDLVKSLEQKGITTDPATFMSYVDKMTKVVEATGGRVTPAQFMSAIKYGRTAALGWDEGFITGALPRLIQSMSGAGNSGTGGPGNALMSAFAKVVQGQMPKKAAEEFSRLGLTTSYSDIQGSSQAEAGIRGASAFSANPYEWVQTVLMPTLKANGITSQDAIIQEISKLFPVRTASQVITEMGLQGRFSMGANSPFEKDMRLQNGAMGLGQSYSELSSNDYSTVMAQLTAQFQSLLQVLGAPAAVAAIPVLKSLTDTLTTMSRFASQNQGSMDIIVRGIVALGGALLALGSVAMIAAAIAIIGPETAAVAAVVGAISVLAAIDWKDALAVAKFLPIVGQIVTAVELLAGLNWNAVAAALTGIEKSIQGFIQWITSVPSSILSPGPDALKPPPGMPGMNDLGHRWGLYKPSSYVPPASGAHAQPVAIYLDGRKVGEMVGRAQARSASWSSNSSIFDGSAMAPVPDQTFA